MSAWTKAYWPRSGLRGSDLERQQLPADERAQARLELRLGDARDGRQAPPGVKLWPRTAASETSARSSGGEPVEPARDQRGEGLGDGQGRQVADRAVHAVLDGQPSLGDEHPDGLDGVQRDAVGAVDDRPHGRRRKSRDEAGEELAHRRLGRAARGRAR